MKKALQSLALAFAGMCVCVFAQAAGYPDNPIRMVVGFPPGGGTDGAARIVAESLSKVLGQAIVVENHAGAGGALGAYQVARATPDGYTLFFGSGAELMIGPITRKATPYRLLRDFSPIGEIGRVKFVLIVPASSSINSVQDLIARAKAHPGTMNFASFGVGSTNHLLGQLFLTSTHIKAVHVPYQGSAQQTTALLSGDIDFTFETAAVALPLIKSGKVKVLATPSPERLNELPDVPTLRELGYPDLVAEGWMGVFAPKGVAPEVVQKLNRSLNVVLSKPQIQDKLTFRGIAVEMTTPEQYRRKLASENAQWRKVAETAHISLD